MALSETTRTRLQTLLDFLRTVEPDRLRMAQWTNQLYLNKEPSCGFAACAIGWAGQIPEFNALGFTCSPAPRFSNETTLEIDWAAVETFFELSGKAAEYLFGMWTYNYDADGQVELGESEEPGHENVLKRIRHFLDTDGELAYWVGNVDKQ